MYDTVVSEKLVNRDPDAAIENIQKIRRDLRRTMSNIRQLIFDIRPMALEDQGLVGAMEELCANLDERNILTVDFVTSGVEHKFPIHTQTALFRIVQEALNNVARHSGVKKAKVGMRYADKALEIIIEDRGKGFNVTARQEETKDKEDHFGIISMKERAELIEARFNISSEIGKGTKVTLIAPYK
jgi:two-component system sensor histidine kinase DegS